MMTVRIINISNLHPMSDYEVGVQVNDRLIGQGIHKGDRRDNGWRKLLEKIAGELPDLEA